MAIIAREESTKYFYAAFILLASTAMIIERYSASKTRFEFDYKRHFWEALPIFGTVLLNANLSFILLFLIFQINKSFRSSVKLGLGLSVVGLYLWSTFCICDPVKNPAPVAIRLAGFTFSVVISLKQLSFIRYSLEEKSPISISHFILPISLSGLKEIGESIQAQYQPWVRFAPAQRIYYRIRPLMVARSLIELLVIGTINVVLVSDFIMPPIWEHFATTCKYQMYPLLVLSFRGAFYSALFHILTFYLTFHSALNLMGEMCGELDREFYYDWWNFSALMQYWNRWNQPVHRYLKHMIFVPMVEQFNFSQMTALMATFLFSGLAHEFAFYVCLKQITTAFVLFFVLNPISYRLSYQIHVSYPNFNVLMDRLSIGVGSAMAFIYYNWFSAN